MDYHHHTNHSFDSKALMQDVCAAAVKKGIAEICFTEHFSVNPYAPTFGHIDFGRYFEEIEFCREVYEKKLIIKAGIELCEPHLLKEEYHAALSPLDLDYVLGSVHNIKNQKLRKYLEGKDAQTAFKGYFEEVYNMVCLADIDVIAHLDLIKRYSLETLGNYDFNEYKEILEAILNKAIERNIGIEINTSGLRSKLKEPLPSVEIIRLYKELGGEILTVGSDSHSKEFTGGHILEAIEIARNCGFKYLFTFKKRQAIPVQLTL